MTDCENIVNLILPLPMQEGAARHHEKEVEPRWSTFEKAEAEVNCSTARDWTHALRASQNAGVMSSCVIFSFQFVLVQLCQQFNN